MRHRSLCKPDPRLGYSRLARCASKEGDELPATGRVHARRLPPPALHMVVSIFINVEPTGFGLLTSTVRSQGILSCMFAAVQKCLQNCAFASVSIRVCSPLSGGVSVLLV